MTMDPFADRLARVRQRFVSTLEGKIDDTCAALPTLGCDAPLAAAAVAEAYRCMHGIVGIGPTVGFPGDRRRGPRCRRRPAPALSTPAAGSPPTKSPS